MKILIKSKEHIDSWFSLFRDQPDADKSLGLYTCASAERYPAVLVYTIVTDYNSSIEYKTYSFVWVYLDDFLE